jgi:hypothetical protein
MSKSYLNSTIYEEPDPILEPEIPGYSSSMPYILDHILSQVPMPNCLGQLASFTLDDLNEAQFLPREDTWASHMPTPKFQLSKSEQQNEQSYQGQSPNRRYECRYKCGEAFGHRRNKRRHEGFSCKNVNRKLVVRCTFGQCKKTFRRPDGLTKHMTGVHKTCTLCTEEGPRTFKTSDEVTKHKLVSHKIPLRKTSGSGSSDTCSSTEFPDV